MIEPSEQYMNRLAATEARDRRNGIVMVTPVERMRVVVVRLSNGDWNPSRADCEALIEAARKDEPAMRTE